MREVLFLMETINDYAVGEPPNRIIRFGDLFTIYEHYSNKVSGTPPCRKHFVHS